MPFIGKDWRSPGDLWVRVDHTSGWELIKLRPIQLSSFPSSRGNSIIFTPDVTDTLGDMMEQQKQDVTTCYPPPSFMNRIDTSSSSLDALDQENYSLTPDKRILTDDLYSSPSANTTAAEESSSSEQDTNEEEDTDDWTPYCFVKVKNRTKEFIGCTSMSEAFHRLDMARAVLDIRRFNYICKVVQILVAEKLQNLSASSRKSLFAIIQAMVLHSVENDQQITTTKDILSNFSSGLDSPHVCGSPQLVTRQQGTCSVLLDLIANISPPQSLSEAGPESTTFLDLPREVLSLILSKLPDHVSLLEAAKANETLQCLVESEQRQWRTLCQFHFSQAQIDKYQNPKQSWRKLFFELKKYYGLRETYADLIHICCHCKALFWKDHGHPCVSKDAPSVRVTPQQFVDMLLFL